MEQIDTQSPRTTQHVRGPAAAVETTFGVVAVHAPVAVDRDAERQLLVDHLVVAELRDEEVSTVAVDAAVERGEAGAGSFCRSHRPEPVEADAQARTGPNHAGEVIGSAEAVLECPNPQSAPE